MIRQDLVGQIASDAVSAIGMFDDQGLLRGVAAWRLYTELPPVLCRCDIVAVAVGAQGRGYGRRLKEAVIEHAEAAGAAAVSSIVDRRNAAMIGLNKALKAMIEYPDDDPEICRCIIPLRRSL